MVFRTILIILLIGSGIFMLTNYDTKNQKANAATNDKPTSNEASVNSDTEKPKKGIQFFKGSWKEAKEKAEESGKPIFVDAYATWCAPCKVMSKRIFTQAEVGDFYNKHFINFKYDMEKGTGPKFRSRYRIKAYPTLVYFNSNGKKVMKSTGFKRSNSLIELGKRAIKQMDDQSL